MVIGGGVLVAVVPSLATMVLESTKNVYYAESVTSTIDSNELMEVMAG